MKAEVSTRKTKIFLITAIIFFIGFACICSTFIGFITANKEVPESQSEVQGISTKMELVEEKIPEVTQSPQPTLEMMIETIIEPTTLPSSVISSSPTHLPSKIFVPTQTTKPTLKPIVIKTPSPTSKPLVIPEFSCSIKKNCSQVANCNEAYYQLNTCNNMRLDGDNDGVPCEKDVCK